MKTLINTSDETVMDRPKTAPMGSSIARIFAGYGPKPTLSPDGDGNADDEAAKGIAAALAAKEKATADAKAAADKVVADAAAAELARKSTMDDEKAKLLKESMERKAQIKILEDKLKAFEGVDPDAARVAAAEKIAAEKTALEKAGDFDRLKAMMAEEHKKELDAANAKVKEGTEALSGKDRVINELTIGNAFSGSTFINTELVLPPAKTRALYGANFDIEDGKVIGYDKPVGATERTKLVDGSGNPLPFEDALKKLVEADPDRDRLIRSKLAAGAGSKTDNLTGTKSSQEQSTDTGRNRIAAALAAKTKK